MLLFIVFIYKGYFFLQNLIEDDYPITNPFYYAQDRESWDAEVAAKAYEESRQQKAEEQTMKKKKNKSKSMSIKKSYIMRKESAHVRHLIKIMIHDLDGRPMDKIRVNPEDASVDVQYLVTSNYDDIMTETEHLVGKIVNKLR